MYPVVNEHVCIKCGECAKVCPVLNPITAKDFEKKLYSGYESTLAFQSKCSSGGIFGLLAEDVVECGGVVYGAVYDPESHGVKHASSDEQTLEQIYRSKYVQSSVNFTYQRVKEQLAGRKCCFAVVLSGRRITFLSCKSYENLTTVDFLCHGVPSPGIFAELLKEFESTGHGTVENITFREKNGSVEKQTMRIYFSDGTTTSYLSLNHFYYYLFLHDGILRKSCMTCDRTERHVSDLTLADDWTQKWQSDKSIGISLIQVNSQRGEDCFNRIFDRLIYREVDFKERKYLTLPHNYPSADRDRVP